MSVVHGYSAYRNSKCRCALCTQAASAYMASWRAQKSGLPEGDPRHGTTNGYINYKCRCNDCCAANTASGRARYQARKARKVGAR